MTTSGSAHEAATDRGARARWWGLGVAALLVAAAMSYRSLTGIDPYVDSFPPLHADWLPRTGPGTVPAVLLGLLAVRYAVDHAAALTWRRLLLVVFLGGLAWMLALALVDGTDGIGVVLASKDEYLRTARETTDLHHTLAIYISRIDFSSPGRAWPVHIAGHPPGALTFFVVLVRLGLGSGLAAGLVVTVIAATAAVAVLVTLRVLGAEGTARRAAPFLVLGPAAIWQCVSADAMFSAVAAWGIACLALAATRTSRTRMVAWSTAAGLLLGYTVMLSYGLVLLGLLALTVLVIARSWRPLVPTVLAALAVVLTYAVLGFSWWKALGPLHDRYWNGIAHDRPTSYWIWGDLALLVLSAGPLLGAVLGNAVVTAQQERSGSADADRRVALLLTGAGAAMVVAADLTLMSKAEVERIWLPFVPWLLVGCALLPEQWRRRGLVAQVVAALLLEHLFRSTW